MTNNVHNICKYQKGTHKVAVLFFCHIVNNYTISAYKKLDRELGNEYCLYWLFQKDNESRETTLMLDGVNLFEFEMTCLNSMGYRAILELYGNDHYVLEYFKTKHPDYKYYWVIEYDVLFSGNWKTFMDSFVDNHADLISAHIEKKNRYNEEWCWWSSIKYSSQYDFAGKVCIKSFNPICRFSNRALCFLNEFLSDKHNSGFYEVLVASVLYNAGYKLEDFGGTGFFVSETNENRFYVQGVGVNNGTIRWRPSYSQTEIRALGTQDKLFHPVKGFFEFSDKPIQNKTILRTKIVYVSVSDSLDYSFFLYLSIYSLLRYHQCDICVLTDKDTKFHPLVECCATIERIDIAKEDASAEWKSRYLKTQIGRYVYGRFLYLDCDTIIVRPIDEIDLINCSLSCSLEYNSMYVNDMGYAHSNIVETNYLPSLYRDAYFNSGVMLCNGSKAALDFFEFWHSEWKNYVKITGRFIDQPSLYNANTHRNGFIKELPSKFNWMTHMHQHMCPDCRILHYWHNIAQDCDLTNIFSSIANEGIITDEMIYNVLYNYT